MSKDKRKAAGRWPARLESRFFTAARRSWPDDIVFKGLDNDAGCRDDV